MIFRVFITFYYKQVKKMLMQLVKSLQYLSANLLISSKPVIYYFDLIKLFLLYTLMYRVVERERHVNKE